MKALKISENRLFYRTIAKFPIMIPALMYTPEDADSATQLPVVTTHARDQVFLLKPGTVQVSLSLQSALGTNKATKSNDN